MASILVEEKIKENFIKFLIQQGYPQNRIVTDWGNGKFRFDLVIVDEDLKTPLVIYEIKNQISANQMRVLVENAKKYASTEGITIPVYIVFPDPKIISQFEIVNVSDMLYCAENGINSCKGKTVSSDSVMPYQVLANGAESKRETQKQVKRRAKIDKIKPICWILIPLIGIVLIFLDAFSLYTFTTERLIVWGMLLIVILLPFFSEISLGDVSVKRKKEDKKE